MSSAGDVIGCYLEISNTTCEISFSKNGTSFGTAFKLTKSPGTLFPAICMKNAECHVNFGDDPFSYPPADGFVGVATAPPGEYVSGPGGVSSTTAAAAGAGDTSVVGPVCIILEPARDLAEQTHKCM